MKIFMSRSLKAYGSALMIGLSLLSIPAFAAPYAQTGTTAQPQATAKQL